jgi:hypothetical protein
MKDGQVLQWLGTPTGRMVLWVAAGAAVVAAIVTLAVMAALAMPGQALAAPAGEPPASTTPQDPHAGHAHAASGTPPDPPAAGTAEPAPAQGPPPTLDIVFDTVSDERAISAELNVPFEFSVVARHAQGGIAGWEAHVIVDKRLAVLERKVPGLNMAPGEDNWQVGLGENCQEGDEVVLARYKAIMWVEGATDMVLGLSAIPRSSFNPASPGYLTCLRQGDIRTMSAADTLAVVNPLRVKPMASGEKPGASLPFTPARDRH